MKENLVAELLAATAKSMFGIIFLSVAFLYVSQIYLKLLTPVMLTLELVVLVVLFLNVIVAFFKIHSIWKNRNKDE